MDTYQYSVGVSHCRNDCGPEKRGPPRKSISIIYHGQNQNRGFLPSSATVLGAHARHAGGGCSEETEESGGRVIILLLADPNLYQPHESRRRWRRG